MNGQSFILIAIALFVGLIVTVAAVDEYLFSEHPPTEPDGLIWRVENAFSRIQDLEAFLRIVENDTDVPYMRMRVRLVNEPPGILSVRYLDPAAVYGQMVTVQNDQLSYYLPSENIIVVKRWVGIPLASVGLASLNLSQLRQEAEAGAVKMRVLQNVHSFSDNSLMTPIVLGSTLADDSCPTELSFCPDLGGVTTEPGFTQDPWHQASDSLSNEYVLEVRDARTDDLMRMVWVDRETYLIQKVVFYEGGLRSKTISVERYTLNQGLTVEDVLFLPRGVPSIRG